MQLAESVTFGGSHLDRAVPLREAEALSGDEGARLVLPLWRGKPLLGPHGLGFLSPDHAALADAGMRVLLGRAEGRFYEAADLSAWLPTGGELPGAGFFDGTEQHHPLLPDDLRFAELRGVMAGLSPLEAEIAATGKAILGWHASHRFCSACGRESAAILRGWQRKCPGCGALHFPRTDPVVIMLITRGNSVLLGRSSAWPPGMFSLLAGFMEPGETIEAAVRREVAEETAVRVGAVRYLACQPWPYPSSLMIGCQGEALSEAITLDPAELEAARWVSREEMAAVFLGAHPDIRAPRKGAIAGFLLEHWLADRLD
jgi:NAD+ diphosphatase